MMSVSVVMPARNAAAYIGEAIKSVLAQGEHLHELIVVGNIKQNKCNGIQFMTNRVHTYNTL